DPDDPRNVTSRYDISAQTNVAGRLLAGVTDHASPAYFLPPRQFVTSPGERVFAATELDPDRRALEPQCLPERVLQVAPVVVRRALGLGAVDHDHGRIA